MSAPGQGASGAPPSIGRVDALDGIRAIAILGVLGWHASEHSVRGGHLGVAVFFTLSGFLITTLLLDERAATGRVDLRRFYRRRTARLVPALVVAVAAGGLLAMTHPRASTPHQALVGIVSTLTYTSNFVAALARQQITDVLSWSWSLSLEEQFYLLWPALFLLGLRSPRHHRTLVRATVVCYVALTAWRVVIAGGLDAAFSSRVYFGPDTRVDAVVVGCLLALLLHRPGGTSVAAGRRTAVLAAPAFVLLLALLALGSPVHGVFLADLQLTPLLTAAVIAGVVGAGDGLVRSVLSWRPLVWIGRRSYSAYLWNTFFFYGTPAIVVRHWLSWGVWSWIAVTLGAAHVSYRFIEQPFLRRFRSSVAQVAPTPQEAPDARTVPVTPRAVPTAAVP
ncbi:MAG: acyltransferase family protein [Frankiaceae bacterium]